MRQNEETEGRVRAQLKSVDVKLRCEVALTCAQLYITMMAGF